MAYVSLYRRYRPNEFSSMIGQQHIIRTLRNQIMTGAISHAYLFTGSRGTGKTTTAKIFARAINCLHVKEDGSPCGECEICKALADSSNMDIIEMDAASNNGVDEIRYLLEKVKFAPSVGRYKVYIIDEVHMLSPQAFNALLKTLEEPPEHVVFILATTEVQKILPTVLSRCQRFDFRLVPTQETATLLQRIFDELKVVYDKEALTAIAEAGEGCVRDSLSLAEMCISYCGDKVTYDGVLEVLGATSPEAVLDLASCILAGDVEGSLKRIDDTAREGKSVKVLAGDIAKTLRNLLYCRNCNNANKILNMPRELFAKTNELSMKYDNSKLLRCMEIICSVDGDLRYGSNARLVLETAVVKACDEYCSIDAQGVLMRLKNLEAKIAQGQFAVVSAAPSAESSVSRMDAAEKMLVYLLNTLKKRGMHVEYAYFSKLNKEQLEIKDNNLVIKATSQGQKDSITFYLTDYENVLREAFKDLGHIIVQVEVKEDESKQNIENIKKVFGADKVNIINGGSNNG